MRNVIPYVGITGFISDDEIKKILNELPSDRNLPRHVMIGALASHKTLNGEQNKHPNRYPPVGQIANIFGWHVNVFNVIHYSSKHPESLLDQLTRLVDFGGGYLEGIQLNMAWPDPRVLEKFGEECFPPFHWRGFILQVGNRAFELVNNSPKRLAEKIAGEYRALIDYVLLDSSGGTGKLLNGEELAPYLEELYGAVPELGIGVAGGLSYETLHVIRSLAEKYPRLSIDAEGRLRDENDNLDCVAAKDYLAAALEIFGE